jgi:hypothetical protein
MFSPDYVIPTDDDFETVPHESILLKLEATPDDWLRDSTLRDGPAAYEEAMRRELANWGPEQPWTEGDDTWDTRANSKNKLNLMYFGSRSDLQPRHSELFLADTEFEDAAIAMWNIPKHTAMRARDATRTMVDDQVVDVGDRSLTTTGLMNAKRQTNHRFVNSFKNFSTQDEGVQMNNNTVMGRHQVLTLASIVERETGRGVRTDAGRAELQAEREVVAAIFLRRLKIGMALESDATVNYVTGKSDPAVSLKDTEVNSPYNTYKNAGLPPGPICNPSLSSVQAVMDASDTPYLYFLHAQPSGEVVYSKTFEEHVRNKQKYLR